MTYWRYSGVRHTGAPIRSNRCNAGASKIPDIHAHTHTHGWELRTVPCVQTAAGGGGGARTFELAADLEAVAREVQRHERRARSQRPHVCQLRRRLRDLGYFSRRASLHASRVRMCCGWAVWSEGPMAPGTCSAAIFSAVRRLMVPLRASLRRLAAWFSLQPRLLRSLYHVAESTRERETQTEGYTTRVGAAVAAATAASE